MKYIISISKTYIHRGRHKHKPSTKKQWFVYYYDENGKFHSEKISYLQAMYYKQQKFRRRKFICEVCSRWFLGLIKKESDIPKCPYCN